jgi:hypothetical protein
VEPAPVPGALTGASLAGGAGESAGSALASATVGTFQQVAQLLGANGTTLSLIAPLLTVSIIPGEFGGVAEVEGGVALLANVLPGTGSGSLGQPPLAGGTGPPAEAADEPGTAEGSQAVAVPAAAGLPIWDRIATGLDRAWERVRAGLIERAGIAEGAGAGPVAPPGPAPTPMPAASPATDRRPSSPPPRPGAAAPTTGDTAAADAAIAELAAESLPAAGRRDAGGWWVEWMAASRGRLALPIATAAVVATAAAVPRALRPARGRRGLSRPPAD